MPIIILDDTGGGPPPPTFPVGGAVAMAFLPVKYATGVTIPFEMIKRGVMDLAVSADWTPATGDAKISIDGGADANVGTLPAVFASTAAKWGQALTTGETTGKLIVVTYIDAATKAVEDNALNLFTYGHANAYWPFDLSTAMSGQAVASVTGAVGSVTGAVGSVIGAVGSVTGNVGGNVSGTIGGFVNPPGLKKNTAFTAYPFVMFNSTTGARMAGLTVTATRSLDGAAPGACTNAVVEVSGGLYKINLAAADTNADAIVFFFTATGAKDTIDRVITEP